LAVIAGEISRRHVLDSKAVEGAFKCLIDGAWAAPATARAQAPSTGTYATYSFTAVYSARSIEPS
jgi:hypothetical protein